MSWSQGSRGRCRQPTPLHRNTGSIRLVLLKAHVLKARRLLCDFFECLRQFFKADAVNGDFEVHTRGLLLLVEQQSDFRAVIVRINVNDSTFSKRDKRDTLSQGTINDYASHRCWTCNHYLEVGSFREQSRFH